MSLLQAAAPSAEQIDVAPWEFGQGFLFNSFFIPSTQFAFSKIFYFTLFQVGSNVLLQIGVN